MKKAFIGLSPGIQAGSRIMQSAGHPSGNPRALRAERVNSTCNPLRMLKKDGGKGSSGKLKADVYDAGFRTQVARKEMQESFWVTQKEKETQPLPEPDLLHESFFEGKSLRVSDSDLYQAFLTEATRAAKPSLSLTAMSARTLRSRPMPAFLRPFMNTE